MMRHLAWLYGLFPLERLKAWVLWTVGSRFIVGVMALIFDGEGRVLLFRHSYDREHPWGLPSGCMHGGEMPEETLQRELREEGGLGVRIQSIVGAYREVIIQSVRLAYLCEIGEGAFRPSAEVLECRFFAPSELPACVPATQRAAIRDAQRMIIDSYQPSAISHQHQEPSHG